MLPLSPFVPVVCPEWLVSKVLGKINPQQRTSKPPFKKLIIGLQASRAHSTRGGREEEERRKREAREARGEPENTTQPLSRFL